MARKGSPTISQEDLYPPACRGVRPDVDDARLLDLDADEESPFLRGQKRVSVRRSPLPRKAANGLKWSVLALVFVGSAGMADVALYRFDERLLRFLMISSDNHDMYR